MSKEPGVCVCVCVCVCLVDHANSSQGSPSGHHTQVTGAKLDKISDFASLQINLNGVIHLDEGIRVADGVNIMGYQMRDSFCAHKDHSLFAQLVLGLSGVIR